MRQTLKTYRPFLVFLAKFVSTYAVLTLLYALYLAPYEHRSSPDGISMAVARQTENLIEFFGADARLSPQPGKPWVRLHYNGRYVARIIEGCNAVSVIILFASFVVAFAGRWKSTLIFILAGSLVIYLSNIVRIAVLCFSLYHWPHLEHLLHGVAFPLIIYSIVFILWVIWVNRFSYHARKNF